MTPHDKNSVHSEGRIDVATGMNTGIEGGSIQCAPPFENGDVSELKTEDYLKIDAAVRRLGRGAAAEDATHRVRLVE